MSELIFAALNIQRLVSKVLRINGLKLKGLKILIMFIKLYNSQNEIEISKRFLISRKSLDIQGVS